MLFRLEHVGPLREAEVDLSRDLIILTGPNNTGKTYLAWNVYGLHRHRMLRRSSAVFARWAKSLLEAPDYRINIDQLFARDYREICDEIGAEYTSQMHQCFAAERGRFDRARVSLSADPALSPMRAYSRLVTLGMGTIEGSSVLLADFYNLASNPEWFGFALRKHRPDDSSSVEPLMTSFQETSTLLAAATPELVDEIEETVMTALYLGAARAMLPHCILFPAERIAVNLFARELAIGRTRLVDELMDASLEGRREFSLETMRNRIGSYPWPIRDSIETANSLARISREETAFADLASEIEQSVLGGKIGVSEHGAMVYSPDEASDQRLEVHLTASVVKSLSSLVFYFRHQARQGDFLIIDEPELNLHPDNQRRVARVLAKAVRRGFKIMISTHSDYITRELNHMVMLSKLPPEEARELGYDPECALDPKRLGVYLFNEHTAQPIPVEDTGFSVKTIDDEINAMNVDAQRLYARVVG